MKPEYSAWREVMKDDMGRFRIASLFWETRNSAREEKMPPLFTTKDKPFSVKFLGKVTTFPSLKAIYMSYNHVPGHEYEFALDVFGSWKHWLALLASRDGHIFTEWQEELTIKIKADALQSIMTIAKETSTMGLAAAKYLSDAGYVPKKLGRVTNVEKDRTRKIAAGVAAELSEDMERMGISVVSGGKK